MKALRFLFLFCTLLLSVSVLAQNEIVLITGQTYKFKSLTQDSSWIKFDYESKSGRLKQRFLNTDDVFSIKKDNKETVLYRSHTNPEDTAEMLSIPEMRLYVQGSQEGRQSYNGTKHFIFGAAFGLGTGIISNSFLVGLITPPAYTLATSFFPVHSRHFNEFGVDVPGLQKIARKKQYRRMRTGTAIKSSFLGVAVGLIIGDKIAPRR